MAGSISIAAGHRGGTGESRQFHRTAHADRESLTSSLGLGVRASTATGGRDQRRQSPPRIPRGSRRNRWIGRNPELRPPTCRIGTSRDLHARSHPPGYRPRSSQAEPRRHGNRGQAVRGRARDSRLLRPAGGTPAQASFILLELGGAFTAGVAVERVRLLMVSEAQRSDWMAGRGSPGRRGRLPGRDNIQSRTVPGRGKLAERTGPRQESRRVAGVR